MTKLQQSNLLDSVDKSIYQYINIENPKSFLLFAGAGSGKTRTLVNVLQEMKNNEHHHFVHTGQKIAVITYTNAACDEIKNRLQYDPMFQVSTIHSFAWNLIKPFTEDIREWLSVYLNNKISKLQEKIDKARDKQGKTALKNAASRDSKQSKLANLQNITSFHYSPTGNIKKKGSLNHAEVISITADFLTDESLMQKMLVNRFPILLIDESQDTNKGLLESFIATQKANSGDFCLGLFGDLMQRIYGGGKHDLNERGLPDNWMFPAKIINYRSPKRVIALINSIRIEIDNHLQKPIETAVEGLVRLFVVNSNVRDKSAIENQIRRQMSDLCEDDNWISEEQVKCLTLEHAMAARRGKFDDFFIPFQKVDKLRDAALNGTSAEIKFITDQVLQLVIAIEEENDFEVTRIIKKYSNILNSSNQRFVESPFECIEDVDSSIQNLKALLTTSDPNLLEVIEFIRDSALLNIPETLRLQLRKGAGSIEESNEDAELESEESIAWNLALTAKLGHIKQYYKYVNDELSFGTHQGVKGLEFERVMAILDDNEANGFLFDYEKLLGAKALSNTDIKNEAEGKDSTPLRTRRLFYVICSRAEKSLAIVAYTENPQAVKAHAISSGWFNVDEVVEF